MPQGSYLDIAWHPDSRILNMTSGDPVVRTWDSSTGRELAQHRLAPPPSTEGASIAFFSLDGRYLLVGSTEGRIHVLDAHTLVPARQPIQVHRRTQGDPGPVDVADFTPSGDLHTAYLNDVVVDYVSGTVRPWPARVGTVRARVPSSDGRRLLVATDAGTGLLDATTLRWISRPSAAQTGLVASEATAFSHDGRFVASVNNGRLSYWDARTGALLGSVAVEWDGSPAFTRDDSTIVFAGEGGRVADWHLDPKAWVTAACRLAGRGLTEEEWRTYLPDRPYQRVCQS
jgi:WD40 repeat protein